MIGGIEMDFTFPEGWSGRSAFHNAIREAILEKHGAAAHLFFLSKAAFNRPWQASYQLAGEATWRTVASLGKVHLLSDGISSRGRFQRRAVDLLPFYLKVLENDEGTRRMIIGWDHKRSKYPVIVVDDAGRVSKGSVDMARQAIDSGLWGRPVEVGRLGDLDRRPNPLIVKRKLVLDTGPMF